MPLLAPPSEGSVQQGSAIDDAVHPSRLTRAIVVASPGGAVAVRWWLVQTLSTDERWRAGLLPATDGALALTPTDTLGMAWIAVTAISRTGVAGPAATWRVQRGRPRWHFARSERSTPVDKQIPRRWLPGDDAKASELLWFG